MQENFNFKSFRGYRTTIKSSLSIPNSLHQVIIGSLLGDFSVQKTYITSNSRLMFGQSIKNRIYIDHLYSLFQEYCGSRPTIKSRNNKNASICFNTLSLSCFNVYREQFNKFNGIRYKKIIPEDIGIHLTLIGLAYWIMDDGSRMSGNKGLIWCTDSYTLNETKFLIKILKNKFNLDCSIQKYKNRIYIKKHSINILRDLVKPHMLPHFYYKIDDIFI